MNDQFEDNPPLDLNSSGEDLREYFSDVLPNYDPDRVKVADIKKVIKWFVFLKEGEMLSLEDNTDDTNNNPKE
jgi:hypothetical protein